MTPSSDTQPAHSSYLEAVRRIEALTHEIRRDGLGAAREGWGRLHRGAGTARRAERAALGAAPPRRVDRADTIIDSARALPIRPEKDDLAVQDVGHAPTEVCSSFQTPERPPPPE